MKRIFVLFLSLWLIIGFLAPSVTATEHRTISADGCVGTDAQRPFMGQLSVIQNGTSAIIFEINSQTLLYALSPDLQVSPSSCVKIMTALLAIEEGNLDDPVKVTREALNAVSIGAVTAKLQNGEVLTLRDLLYCMLVGSANDAAAVIAQHIAGSQADFVAKMNARATELGCTGTNFTNAHGLHNDEQYTTARDTVKILLQALESDVFREIFGALKYSVPATAHSPQRELISGNYLMINDGIHPYYDNRVTGGRTGIAQDGTRCMAATAKSGNMELITVVFGTKSKYAADGYTTEVQGGFQETTQMLDAAFNGYCLTQILYENQVLAHRTVQNGDNALTLTPAEPCFAILPASYLLSQVEYRFQDTGKAYAAPIEKGSVQTSVEIWYGSYCIGKTDLLACNDVQIASSKLGQLPASPKADLRPLGIILLTIAVAPVAVILGIRTVNVIRGKRTGMHRRGK